MNNKRKSVGGGGINKMKYGTALVLANDVIFLAIPRLSKDCVNSEPGSIVLLLTDGDRESPSVFHFSGR